MSASAADNIGGVIAAIADLLHIAIPPTYEISRSPSPPPFSTASAADLYRLGFSSSAKRMCLLDSITYVEGIERNGAAVVPLEVIR